MRVRGRQILSGLFVLILMVLVYSFYGDKLTLSFSMDNKNSQETVQFEGKLTAETSLGKVITRSTENGWKVDQLICKQKKDFVLAHLRDPPQTPIFVYSAKEDQWVSGSIIRGGSWESNLVSTILDQMRKFPNAIFLDLGANVGMFSISIAAHGFRTISVDCLEGNVMRLCASMKAAKLTDKMTVVYNALSHRHEKVVLGKYKGNVGGTYVKEVAHSDAGAVNSIFLDDLLELFSLDQVVIKMDVETYEANVLKGAYKFFKEVKVEALLMEFVAHKKKDSGKFIADFLASYGLMPKVADSIKDDYTQWGNEVLFLRKKESKPVAPQEQQAIGGDIQSNSILEIKSPDDMWGKIVSYSDNKWISDANLCPTDTNKFVKAQLGYPFNIPMFVYTEAEDKWISGKIIQGGVWEGDLVNNILSQMDSHPQAVFLDIGSNIGVFSLAVASRHRKVISIDCLKGNIERLCNSVKVNSFTDRLSIISNAVSSERKTFSLGTYEGNVGGTYLKESAGGDNLVSSILLDDLLSLIPLKEVVIKMDVETHEANVLDGAAKFFQAVKVHYVLLEFVAHKGKPSGDKIRDFFDKNGMEPILPSSSQFTDTSSWPNEVAFKRKPEVPKNVAPVTTASPKEPNLVLANPDGRDVIKSESETLGKVISRSSMVQEWQEASSISCEVQPSFVRANLNRDQNTPIYVYSVQEDQWVSGNIIRNGNWEGDLVQKIWLVLQEFPDATFLDLGANVGMFSLSIAKKGRRVISFECLKGNVERLCASMKNNPGFSDRMTIVFNALSNQREKVTLGTYKGNVGGTFVKKIESNSNNENVVDSILLDDILEIFKLEKVVMKMDVETFEAKILEGADTFFSKVEVEALLMEFVSHKGKKSGDFIVQFLEKHNLFPVLTPGMDKYDTTTWKKGEVMFKRKAL